MDSFIPLNQEVLRGTVQLSELHHQREREKEREPHQSELL